MFEELIQNGYVLSVLARHPRQDWVRVTQAILVFGARELQSKHGNILKDISLIEELAYGESAVEREAMDKKATRKIQAKPVEVQGCLNTLKNYENAKPQQAKRMDIAQCSEELRRIKEGLSRLDEKVYAQISSTGTHNAMTKRALDNKENVAENTIKASVVPNIKKETNLNSRTPLEGTRREENTMRGRCLDKPNLPPRDQAWVRSCSPRGGRDENIQYPLCNAPAMPQGCRNEMRRVAETQNTGEMRRQTRERELALSEAAKETVARKYSVADLKPVKMVFEKKEFTKPFMHRLPQPIVVTKTREPTKPESQPATAVKETKTVRKTSSKLQAWNKGMKPAQPKLTKRKSQEPVIAPKYLQNVQSKIKDKVVYDRHVNKVKKDIEPKEEETYEPINPPRVQLKPQGTAQEGYCR